MKKLLSFVAVLSLFAAVAFAASERVDKVGSPFPQWFVSGIYVGPASVGINTTNKVTRILSASATIDFASSTVAPVYSSSVPVTGARTGDPCFVGPPAAAGQGKSEFSCYVDAADSVKVVFVPTDYTKGQTPLVSASPSTAIVPVSVNSICTCTPVGASAAIAAAGCATGIGIDAGIGLLTMTGPNTVTTTETYDCAAPVDPASGTYYVTVVSSQ